MSFNNQRDPFSDPFFDDHHARVEAQRQESDARRQKLMEESRRKLIKLFPYPNPLHDQFQDLEIVFPGPKPAL